MTEGAELCLKKVAVKFATSVGELRDLGGEGVGVGCGSWRGSLGRFRCGHPCQKGRGAPQVGDSGIMEDSCWEGRRVGAWILKIEFVLGRSSER